MFDFLSDIGEAVSDGVGAAVDAVTDGVSTAVDAVTDGVSTAVDTAKGLASVVGDIGANAAKATGAALSDAADAISDAVSGIPDDITEVPGYLAGVWGDFWEFEIESIDAIGGLLLDEAEYLADAEELPGWFRDICEGIIGSDDELSLGGVVGATLGGLGKCASDLGKWGSQLLGNPAEIAQNCYDSAKYVWQHRSEIPSKISSEISNWWNDTTTYEKITTVVEAYAMYRVFASGGAEGETVTLESEAAGVTGEAGEAAGIAAEAGEAGGMVGSEGVAAVEGAAEEAAGAIEGAAGEAAEAIEGAAGKGKIRIESASESGSGSKPYTNSRPSYGKNQVNEVWENAKDPITGKVYDPSGVEITWDKTKPRNGQWDMGHIPGEKYSEMHQLYMDDVISKDEFLEWYRNPKNYRPELPSTNRSHKYE